MRLDIARKSFVDGVLSPVAAVTDRCVFTLGNGVIRGIGASSNHNVFAVTEHSINTDAPDGTEMNVGDIKKLLRAVDSLKSDTDDTNLTFELTENALKYKGKNIKFNYHLYAKNIISKLPVSREKIISAYALPTNKTFSLTPQEYNQILSGSYYTTDTSKVYFYTEEDGNGGNVLMSELGDRTRPNVDVFITKITRGDKLSKVLPFDVESFKLVTLSGLSSAKDSTDRIELKFNEDQGWAALKVVKENYNLIYFLSALIK